MSMAEIRKLTSSRMPKNRDDINLLSGIEFISISKSHPYAHGNFPSPQLPSAKLKGSTYYWENVCMDFNSAYPVILWPNDKVLATHLHPELYEIGQRFVDESENIYPRVTESYLMTKNLKTIIRRPLESSRSQRFLNNPSSMLQNFTGFYTIPGRTLLINVRRESNNVWHATADGALPTLLTIQNLIEQDLNCSSEMIGENDQYIPFENFKLSSIDFFFITPTSYGNGNNHQSPENYFLGNSKKQNVWSYVGPMLRAMISMINLSKVKALVYDANEFPNNGTMICFEELIYRAGMYNIATPKLKTQTVHYLRYHLNQLFHLPIPIPQSRAFPGTAEKPFRITIFGREDTWKRRWLNIDDFLYRINYFSRNTYLDIQRYTSFANLSLYQQVVIHSQTDLLIEVHGAALTSIMWMPVSSIVVQISGTGQPAYFHLMNRILNLTQIPVVGYTLDPLHTYDGKCRIDRNIPLHRCLVVPPRDIFDALSKNLGIELDIEST